jgi:hypothetical protein
MFEIYEEDYLADDAELGLLWPVCQQSKTKLSRRHLDAMRPAYQNGTLKIHGVDADVLKKELENPQYIMDNEVGYIMKTSRTLPINGYGRLPQDKSGLFEWFRQHTSNFKLSNVEYLRKGTIHDDDYNIFHAVVDALNFGGYQTKTFEQKHQITRNFIEKCINELSIRLFRVLENGTLATKISYENFLKELRDPNDKLLHTTVLDLLCRVTKTNIAIFDNDAKTDSVETYWLNTFGMYKNTIMLLKMRNNYETIVFYNTDDETKIPRSVFSDDNEFVKLIQTNVRDELRRNRRIHLSRQIIQKIETILKTHFNGFIIGQCVNASNQTTSIVTSGFDVAIPIPYPHPPFDNTVLLPEDVNGCEQTLKEFKLLSSYLEMYTPLCWIAEHNSIIGLVLANPVSKTQFRSYNDMITNASNSNRDTLGLMYVKVIPRTLDPDEQLLFLDVDVVDNRDLTEPYYPDINDAIVLSSTKRDDRTSFIEELERVRKCVFDVKKALYDQKEEHIPFFEEMYFSKKQTKQQFRIALSEFLKQYLIDFSKNLVQENEENSDTIDTINSFFREIHFVLVAYFYRNPDFFFKDRNFGSAKNSSIEKNKSQSTDTKRFFSTKHTLEWIQRTTQSSFIGNKAKIQSSINVVAYPPVQGSIFEGFDAIDEIEVEISAQHIIRSYIKSRFPENEVEKGTIFTLKKLHEKMSAFPDDRRVFGTNITFKDLDCFFCLEERLS